MKVLKDKDATHENILSSLEEVSHKAERGSVVVIHFSGHGYELPDQFDQGLIPATLTREMVSKIRTLKQDPPNHKIVGDVCLHPPCLTSKDGVFIA